MNNTIKNISQLLDEQGTTYTILNDVTMVILDKDISGNNHINIRNYFSEDECISNYCSVKEFKEKVGELIWQM